jgi:uncharacterized protein YndB with AHSA1/START domain
MTMEKGSQVVQVHKIYIRATPQAIWDAITKPEWTERYGYKGRTEYDLRPGGAFKVLSPKDWIPMGMPEVALDGEVVEADPPRKLVQTYRFLFTPEQKAEGFTRVTWEIEDTSAGFSKLTVTHELDGAPLMAGMVGSDFDQRGAGGWGWILSDMKSVLETGKTLGG